MARPGEAPDDARKDQRRDAVPGYEVCGLSQSTHELISRRDAIFVTLVAALPLLGYQFGLGNQVEQFSLVRRLSDPDFIPADFYVNSATGFGPRFYYSWLVSVLVGFAHLPFVMFVLTCATNFALAVISFDAARRHLRADHLGGAIAALIVVVNGSFSLGLAGFIRFDDFQPASLAIPLALGGFSLLIARQRLAAAAAFTISAAMHPLIGAESAMIAFVACGLADLSRSRDAATAFKFLVAYIPSGLALAAAIGVLWVVPLVFLQNSGRIPDAEFFAILIVFRAPHHYLASTFPAAHYLSAAVFVAASFWMILQFGNHRTVDFPSIALALAGGIVVVLCAASFLFVDIAHNGLWATAQVFRLLFVVKWVGFLFFAWTASRWLKERSLIGLTAAIAPVVVPGDAQPFAMAASLAATTAVRWLPDKSRGEMIAAILLTAVTIAFGAKAGVGKDIARAGVGIVCATLVYAWSSRAAIALVAVLIAFGAVNRNREFVDFAIFRPTYGWDGLKGPDAEIARWAKENTPTDSLWATPPDFESFRLIAERAIIVDFTSFPFQAMREWRARIGALYGEVKGDGFEALSAMDANYRTVNQATLEQVARAYGADFAVLYADTPWTGEVLHWNEKYKAVKITPAER